jgi:ring-1,2-phenylacetyl-CoA epoxidase subunit PaaC
LVLGHRTSEWTGHAPLLEEELALANIALDLIGQARMLYQAAGELTGHSEDELAYLRDPPAFRNALIMELPNGDFAFTIARLFLVSVASDQKWRGGFDDAALTAIAEKAMKETAYHVRHAAEWLIRLGDGTEQSHRRAQDAIDALWPFTGEITASRARWLQTVAPVLTRATLRQPKDGWMQSGGRAGRHTEHLGHLLAEMQVLPRTYPGAAW